MKSAWAWAALLLVGCASEPPPELDVSVWYWHTPFEMSEDQAAELVQFGVDRLYVRGGTFTTDGTDLELILRQSFEGESPMPCVATFNFDAGLIGHLDEIPEERMAEQVADAVQPVVEAGGCVGVQMDVDSPTRLLDRYGRFLSELRDRLPDAWELSATGLATWFDGGDVAALAPALDFLVPQFYEGRLPSSPGDPVDVADLDEFRRYLDRLDRYPGDLRVGLPAYGHAKTFDGDSRFVGLMSGFGPREVTQFQIEPPAGASEGWDDVVWAKRGDSTVAVVAPSQRVLADHVRALRENRPDNVLGAILFRVPEPSEALALPVASMRSAWLGEEERVDFELELSADSSPLAVIEGAAVEDRLPWEVVAQLEHTGNAATTADASGMVVSFRFDSGGVIDAISGDFDTVEIGRTIDGRFQATSRLRADTIRFRRALALPGEVLRAGPVRLAADGPAEVEVSIAAQSHGGASFRTSARELAPQP